MYSAHVQNLRGIKQVPGLSICLAVDIYLLIIFKFSPCVPLFHLQMKCLVYNIALKRAHPIVHINGTQMNLSQMNILFIQV